MKTITPETLTIAGIRQIASACFFASRRLDDAVSDITDGEISPEQATEAIREILEPLQFSFTITAPTGISGIDKVLREVDEVKDGPRYFKSHDGLVIWRFKGERGQFRDFRKKTWQKSQRSLSDVIAEEPEITAEEGEFKAKS